MSGFGKHMYMKSIKEQHCIDLNANASRKFECKFLKFLSFFASTYVCVYIAQLKIGKIWGTEL